MSDAIMDVDVHGLVELIDRLEVLLNDSNLSEIEVESGSTMIIVRKPVAAAAPAADGASGPLASAAANMIHQGGSDEVPANAVLAPLTGLYYSSPSPGAQPYVAIGTTIIVGQVIGLIEAMKLFNEIKSDRVGRVKRLCVEDGALVKSKQALIEVEE